MVTASERVPLVGRGAELLLLGGLVERVRDTGGAVVVRGEAGIGKPALLVEAGRMAADSTYVTGVPPGVVLFGLGLSLTVAPLTATALGAVDERHAGVASGVNNAVARAAGLLAVAVLPLAAGLGTGSLTDPDALAPTYRTAMVLCAGLLLTGAAIAITTIPTKHTPQDAARTLVRTHCDIAGPPLHPVSSGALLAGSQPPGSVPYRQ